MGREEPDRYARRRVNQLEQLQPETGAEKRETPRILSPELKVQFETLRGLLQRALWLAERCADTEATQILRARLFDIEMKRRAEIRDAAESQKMDISFGSQIRSYVLAPYRMVKDLRTGMETGNVDKFLDGDLDDFITAQLMGVKNPARAVPE